MKVKRLREDFVVREVTQFPLSGGHFSTYVLEKNGLGTPEAIQEIIKVWNLPRNQISYGGLKDRHAITSQTITIFRGPDTGDITHAVFVAVSEKRHVNLARKILPPTNSK